MFIKLEVKNFRSIRDRMIFHTVQRNYKRFTNHIYKHNDALSLLKTTALYGANGSGKTNIFKALYFVKRMIEDTDFLNSTESSNMFHPFRLNAACLSADSSFKVQFIQNEIIYHYEISVNHQIKKVTFERLMVEEDNLKKVVFERRLKDDNLIIFNLPMIPDGEKIGELLPRLVLSYSTFLSTNIILDNNHISNAKKWFKDKLKFLFPVYDFSEVAFILNLKDEYLALASSLIKYSTIGIDGLTIQKIPISVYLGSEKTDTVRHIHNVLETAQFHPFRDSYGNPCTAIKDEDGDIIILKLMFVHKDVDGNDVVFELEQESKGTISLMHFIPALILSYGEGVNYFIDDINTSLHPILIREILAQFLKHNLENAKGQLIFNSHEDFLIDEKLFRQDELWLAEKNKEGASDIFPLSDFPNLRFDLNLKKNYLNGKFGGVPFPEEPEDFDFSSLLS